MKEKKNTPTKPKSKSITEYFQVKEWHNVMNRFVHSFGRSLLWTRGFVLSCVLPHSFPFIVIQKLNTVYIRNRFYYHIEIRICKRYYLTILYTYVLELVI